jgi:hypothetical protein
VSDIVERLRGGATKDYGCSCPKCEAADEIERLRAELAAMQKQRDEARRIVCIRIALDETKHYMGTHGYPCSKGPGAMEIAAERGWDCFGQGGGE